MPSRITLKAKFTFQTLASESSLINLAFFGSAEGHAVALELEHGLGRLAAHVVDGVLVAEPVTALDRVVGVPAPVIFRDVAERGVDSALGGHGVTARGEEFGDAGGLVALLDQAERGAETCSAGPDHHGVIGMVDDVVGGSQRRLRRTGVGSLLGNHGKTFFIEKRSLVQAS